jgi:hypothetical protein
VAGNHTVIFQNTLPTFVLGDLGKLKNTSAKMVVNLTDTGACSLLNINVM